MLFNHTANPWAKTAINELESSKYSPPTHLILVLKTSAIKKGNCESFHFSATHEGEQEIRKPETTLAVTTPQASLL